MPEIIYEKRVVAFLDILGFSQLVDQSVGSPEDMEKLRSLVGMLEGAIPRLDQGVSPTVPLRLIPKYIYISDSIVLISPLNDVELKQYNGLEILVMRCIQLSHFFLKAGYLLRGGIAVGDVWHNGANIVGPAYQEAYRLEQSDCRPCVILSTGAKEFWNKSSSNYSRMCILDHGTLIVNGLHDYYIDDQSLNGVKCTYNMYTNLVNSRLEFELLPGPKAKWEWIKSFLEVEISEASKWHDSSKMPPNP